MAPPATSTTPRSLVAPNNESPTSAYILSIASTFPPNEYTQVEMRDAYLNRYKFTEKDANFITRVFDASHIDTCRSFLPKDKLFYRMDRAEYMTYIRGSLKTMSIEASKRAIAEWGGDLNDITHIVYGTMTGGMHAPAMDIEVMYELKLNNRIKRLNVENMGCLTGFRCLALANSLARENPKNRVLMICGDIRSAIQNQFEDHPDFGELDRANAIVAALFRDSCSASIIGMDTDNTQRPLFQFVNHESYLIPDSFEFVEYTERQANSIHLFIDRNLPALVGKNLPTVMKNLLEGYEREVDLMKCDFALHTGGPKVLNYVQEALGIQQEQIQSSWEVMRKYGNLSGSSNMIVLNHLREMDVANPHASNGAEEKSKYVICLSFGPGIYVESVLLKKCY